MINLYSVSRCPCGARCEACGTEHGLLRPWAVRINRGVLCLTLCPGCTGGVTRDGTVPISDSTAGRLVDQHCGHLELNLRQMGLKLAEEDRVAREEAARAAAAGTAAPDPDFLRALGALPTAVDELTRESVNGHGTRPPGHPHVRCSVCRSDMVHVDVWRDGSRVYAAHPMIPGEPDSAQCSNTDYRVGTHHGGPVPSPPVPSPRRR